MKKTTFAALALALGAASPAFAGGPVEYNGVAYGPGPGSCKQVREGYPGTIHCFNGKGEYQSTRQQLTPEEIAQYQARMAQSRAEFDAMLNRGSGYTTTICNPTSYGSAFCTTH